MFLTSMFSGVDFTPQDNVVPYDDTKMYVFEPENEPTYLHGQKDVGMPSAQYSCRTGKYTSDIKLMVYKDESGNDITHSVNACWFESTQKVEEIPNVGSADFKGTDTWTCKTSEYISAPYDCTCITPSEQSDGTSMILIVQGANIPTYKLTIANMSMWYCDVGREFKGDSSELRHTYDADSQFFERGQVLGKAKAGETTIKVQLMEGNNVSSTAITLYDFFTQGGNKIP